MPDFLLPLLVVVIVMTAVILVIYFLGKRAQKKQAEQNEKIASTAQYISIFVLDKKKMNVKKSGLPDEVINATPWYMRWSKVPIVKAKAGPRVITFICDPQVFDLVPVKREVKATVSGIYISAVKGMHQKIVAPEKKQNVVSRILFGKK